jgi:hypothetical protein
MYSSRWGHWLGVAALALLMGGCGGGETSTTQGVGTSALTKAQFLKLGNTICAEGNEEIDAVYGKYAAHPPGEAKMNQVAQEIVPPVRRKVVRRLRALDPPAGEEKRVEEILEAIEEGIEKGEEDAASLRAYHTAYAFGRAYKMELEYGLTKCALD